MKKLISLMPFIILSTASAIIILLTFWTIYPYKIADFNVPFKIVNPVVKRGDRVRYVVDGCKYVNTVPTIVKFFIDGVVYETPKSLSVVPKGCGITIADAYVPKALPAGIYSLKTVAEYKVNPIRTVQIINYTEQFEVK